MIVIMNCSQCNQSKNFDITLHFNYESKFCSSCHHLDARNWDYYFCDINCLFNWLRYNKIEEEGFPCRSCFDRTGLPSGYSFGFKENGICKICNGLKRVNTKMEFKA